MKIMKKQIFAIFSILLISNTECQHPYSSESDVTYRNQDIKNTASSFLTMTEQSTTKSTLKAQVKEMVLLASAVGRVKKRYTKDGRVCAAAFVQDGITYQDCTTVKSPDDSMNNQEWCYVDNSQKGEKPWDYCIPTMDYDKVRKANQDELVQVTIRTRKTESKITKTIPDGLQALQTLKDAREGQSNLSSKITKLISETMMLNNKLSALYELRTQWEDEENKAVDIAVKIEEKKDALREAQLQKSTTTMNASEETIRSEMEKNKCIIAPFLQERKMSAETNCEGMLSYEEEPTGDGLIARYYDNSMFSGNYVETSEPSINFDWTGGSPVKGINSENFSAKWEGYIFVPLTSNYKFSIECDDGAMVTLNNKVIIKHKMYSKNSEDERIENWLDDVITSLKNPTKNYIKSTSNVIKLAGGTKYKITVAYYHSIIDDITNDDKSFVNLYWSSDEFDETIIPRRNFYTQNSFPPLKITVDPKLGVVRKLYENDLAFKNTDLYILQDIPKEFNGLVTVKLISKVMDDEIVMFTNIPVVVYVGRLDHYPHPLSADWSETGEAISLLQIEKPKSNSPAKEIQSLRSTIFRIYRKNFHDGKITIKLSHQGINAKGIPLLVFFGFDSETASPLSCGGDEVLISDPTGIYFKECDQSSVLDNGYDCQSGFGTKHLDQVGGIWATNSEGTGAWISIEFKGVFSISKFKFKNRSDRKNRNKVIKVTFGDGDTKNFTLKDSYETQEFSLDTPIKESMLRFTIEEVYAEGNNGLSVEVWGTKCENVQDLETSTDSSIEKLLGPNSKSIPTLFGDNELKPKILTCKDSVLTSKQLVDVKKTPGSKVLIKCIDNCVNAQYTNVYGDMKYTKDSTICKAAYHSGILKGESGLVTLVFDEGIKGYTGSIKNDVQSKAKARSDLSISFEEIKEKNPIIPITGTRVDYKDATGWMPCIIMEVNDKNSKKILTLQVEGNPAQKPFEVDFENKSSIKPCGSQLFNRSCGARDPNINPNKPIKFKFSPVAVSGDWIVDSGKKFGTDQKPYGWSQDMSQNFRILSDTSTTELNSAVYFNPDPKSKLCASTKNCAIATWQVKVGYGKHNVKVYVEDPENNTIMNMKINGMPFITNVPIEVKQSKVFEGIFTSDAEQMLIFSAECSSNCDYALSRMNMIEVSPFKEYSTPLPQTTSIPTSPELSLCGTGFTGGRCDIGPDVSDCVYDDYDKASLCKDGSIMRVPQSYSCPQQQGKLKCVRNRYNSKAECQKYCPGKCNFASCVSE